MNPEYLEKVNSDFKSSARDVKSRIQETYWQFATGMAAIISMAVYPIIFQFYGDIFPESDGINWLPTLAALLMGGVLVFAGRMRFKADRLLAAQFKDAQLAQIHSLAEALTTVIRAKGLGQVKVVTVDSVPQLVLASK